MATHIGPSAPSNPQAEDSRPEHPQLFISYASGDHDRAAALHRLLAAEGYRASVLIWRERLVCSKYGGRQANMVVTGTKRR